MNDKERFHSYHESNLVGDVMIRLIFIAYYVI